VTVPPGYFECNGQAVSRTTYADLFTAIGVAYGAGDGSTTFNVPDMQDEFIRGKSASRVIGSKQAASLASHTHPTSDPGHAHGASQTAHDHTITTGSHAHGVNDPGHSHTVYGYGALGGTGAGTQVTNGGNPAVNTSSVGTGVSVQTVGNLGGSADARQPAVTVAAAATGLVIGAAGGAETVPQNIAQIYVIKAVEDSSGPVPVTNIDTSDPQMISVDNANPVVPELVIHSNVAFGTVKLDAGGKVPLNQMPTSSQQLLGYFDASGGQNPTEKYPTQTFNSGDTYIISVSGSITVFNPVTLVSSLTPVSAGNLLQFVTGSVSNPTGWYYAVQSTTVIASQVGFTPAAGIVATDVQAAIVEVQGNIPVNATEVPFTPSGTIAALNTQAAIAELDSETQAALALKSNITTTVTKDSNTGAANLPAGSQIQRPAVPAPGMLRFNADSSGFEGFNGTNWGAVGGGATGAPGNPFIYENDIHVTGDYSVTSGRNAMSAGPIIVDNGVTVTVPPGSVWSVV
jgi:microcystin-dependent protein